MKIVNVSTLTQLTFQVRAYKKANGMRVCRHIRTYPDGLPYNNFKKKQPPPI